MEGRMRLRSAVPPQEREREKLAKVLEKEQRLNRPFLTYSGRVHYITSFIDCAVACDDLLKMTNEDPGEHFVVGFDMEWPFSFQTGPGKTALIQISPNLKVCYLLHLSSLKTLPKGLSEFLHHPKVRLTGVNIRNDVHKLVRDYSGLFDHQALLEKCIDSGHLAKNVFSSSQRWSMEKLVDSVLNLNLDKNKKVRMSKWHIVPLKPEQQMYAATDSYASLLLYQELKQKQLELPQTEDTK